MGLKDLRDQCIEHEAYKLKYNRFNYHPDKEPLTEWQAFNEATQVVLNMNNIELLELIEEVINKPEIV